MHRTSEELHANLELSGLTNAEVQTDLGFASAQFAGALNLSDTTIPRTPDCSGTTSSGGVRRGPHASPVHPS